MKKKLYKTSAFRNAIAAALIISILSTIFAVSIVVSAESGTAESAFSEQVLHPSIDISTLTGEGGDPPELLSAASALALEKEWFEYVRYSVEPVGQVAISDNARIVFYDPYDYSNSLVMEVADIVTDWSSANSITETFEVGNSLSVSSETSVSAVSTVEMEESKSNENGIEIPDLTRTTTGKIDTYNLSKQTGKDTTVVNGWEVHGGLNIETGFEFQVGSGGAEVTGGIVALNTISEKITVMGEIVKVDSDTTVTYENTITDDGWEKYDLTEKEGGTVTTKNTVDTILNRISQATGNSSSSVTSWSVYDSHSISKTYNAQYFNANGSPLQWKIIQYTVIMPMECKVQYLIDDEWITTESGYCILTTIQGTCRAWLENNTPYYEHWGTGEPVVWSDFWGRFFTKEGLIEAYKNKLYPDG